MVNINLPEYPKLIAETALNRTQLGENGAYVLTSLQSGKHLRLSSQAYRVASKLDGKHKATDLLKASDRLTEENILEVISTLVTHGFIEGHQPNQENQRPASKKSIESQSMSSRHHLMDASKLLVKIGPYIRWLFTFPGFLIWSLIMIGAGWVLIQNPGQSGSIIKWLFQLNIIDGIIFSLLIFSTKLVHELGHAAALQSMAYKEGIDPGPISIGVTRFFFFLMPYTDATASWRIASPKRRAVIALAGMYLEMLLAAFAIILASQISSDIAKAILYQLAFVAGISTLLFNLNPFIKLDGYHLLSDMLNIQNLQPRSSREVGRFFQRVFFQGPMTDSLNRSYIFYGFGSFLFRCTIFIGIALAGYTIYPPIALGVIAIAASVLFVRPVLKFITDHKDKPLRHSGVAAAILAILVPFMPVRENITVSGLVENQALQNIVLPFGTVVNANPERPGIAFENPSLDHKIQIAQISLSLANLQYQTAVADRDPQFVQLRSAVEDAKHHLARLENDRQQLKLDLYGNGLIYDPAIDFHHQQNIASNATIGISLDASDIRIKLLIPEAHLDQLSQDDATYPVKYWSENTIKPQRAALTPQAWSLVQSLPSASLARKHGGMITIAPEKFQELVPAHSHFSTMMDIAPVNDAHPSPVHGQRVVAVISTGWTFLARSLLATFTDSISSRIEELKK